MSPYLEGGITYSLSGLKISDIALIAIDNQPTALTITGMSARMSSNSLLNYSGTEILAETIESLLDPFPH